MVGIGINFVHIDPIKALFWTAAVIQRCRRGAADDHDDDHDGAAEGHADGAVLTLPRPLWAVGWLSTAVMAVTVVAMFATWGD